MPVRREELLQRLMQTFVLELQEHVAVLNEQLLGLETSVEGIDPARINHLFRAAHSLKGAARSVELAPIEELSHDLEDVFDALRAGRLTSSQSLMPLLFKAVDALTDAGQRLESGQELPVRTYAELRSELRGALSNTGQRFPLPLRQTSAEPGSLYKHAEMPPTRRALDSEPSQNDDVESPSFVQVRADQLDRVLFLGTELRILCMRHHDRIDALEQLAMDLQRHLSRVSSAASDQRLSACIDRLGEMLDGLKRESHNVLVTSAPLDAQLQHLRMVTFREVCEGFPRVVRDLSKEEAKKVELVVKGTELELDRALVKPLRQSLMQLLRNAIGHGIETPATRFEAGKPEAGQLVIRAALQQGRLLVTLEDDGKGVDRAAVLAAATRIGIATAEGEQVAESLIFRPGVSTAPAVDTLSGRGVGLDLVKSLVEKARGRIHFESELGRFTRFAIALPLTLSTIRVLQVRLGEYHYGLDVADVEQMARVSVSELQSIDGRQQVLFAGQTVVVADLASMIGIERNAATVGECGSIQLVLTSEYTAGRIAYVVDEVLGIHDAQIYPLGERLDGLPYVQGASLDVDGRPVPLLNSAEIARELLRRRDASSSADYGVAVRVAQRKPRLLVVDDSMTTRLLEENILRDAGFEVEAVVDGSQAWQRLQTQRFDLVVSDVQMPGMDGFALTRAIRAASELREVPVVLLTARDSDDDRRAGLKAGANAYLVKSAFDLGELITTIRQLLV